MHVCIVLALLVLLLALLQSLSAAQPAQPTGWQVVGQIGGPASAVTVQGNHAYVGVGLRLVALDVTNPITPTEIGATAPFPYFVEDVVVSGTWAYVAAGGAGLRVVDISDPANPTEIGAWDSPGYAEGVAASGDIVYLADGPYGLRAVDVSDPASLTPLGSAYEMNYALEVAVSGDFAYLAAAGAGLLVADVSDPARPVEVGGMDTPGYAQGIAVVEEAAYIADEWEGVQVADISDPANPVMLSSFKTPGWAFGIAISGTRAYVADAFKGLQVLDVSHPAQPTQLGSYEAVGGHAGSVAVVGTIAYVADHNLGLHLLDITDPGAPSEVGSYLPMGYATAVAEAEGYSYVAAGINGLRIVDVSSPAASREVGKCEIQSGSDRFSAAVAVSGNYAYVGTWWQLHVVDVSEPAQPVVVGWVRTTLTGEIREMDVRGRIVYTVNGGGLELFDVTDPTQPALAGRIVLGYSQGVVVSDGLAYVADELAGLEIVDVSDPHAPALLGSLAIGSAFDVAVAGSLVYLVHDGGLSIVDVSEPTQPVEMSFVETSPDARAVVVSDGTAFVADGGQGLSVVDVSNPYQPQLAAVINTPGFAGELDVDDSRIYLADGTGGLAVVASMPGDTSDEPTATDRALCREEGSKPLITLGPSGRTGRTDRLGVVSCDPTAGSGADVAGAKCDARPAANACTPRSIAQPVKHAGDIGNTCIVNSALDSGPGTLRTCLEGAASGDTIIFDTAVFPPTNPVTVSLVSPLPSLSQGYVTVDASGAGVILNGSGTPPGTDGLLISSDGNVIQGLAILRFPAAAISIQGGAHNRVGGDRLQGRGPLGQGNLLSGNSGDGIDIGGASNCVIGNFIGTDLSGTTIVSNSIGVNIGWGAGHNVIGSSVSGERNVIAGNSGNEVMIWSDGTDYNVIQGNMIGTDPSGTFALRALPPAQGYVSGVQIHSGAAHNTIGPGNVIGGVTWGVSICCAQDNQVVGNWIGTDMSGTADIGNSYQGVDLSNGAQEHQIGPGNRIAYNGGAGVVVDGASTLSNTITANAIYKNAGEGIATNNGGNASLAPPILVTASITTVLGTAPPGAMVEVFSDWEDEGEVYEGQAVAAASGTFTFTLPSGLTGPHVTATATDAARNTSEFSAPMLVVTHTGTITVTSVLDSGPGSLRQALLSAWPGNTIIFDPAVFSPTSPVTIALDNPLPAITQGYITIDGSNAGVVLDGSYLQEGSDGLQILSDGNIVQGLQILRFPRAGVRISDAKNNRIGGDRSQGTGPIGQGNVISGSGSGVHIGGSKAMNNVVVGNLIGTDVSGTNALGNGDFGVILSDGASQNRIGGDADWERNIVSGNVGQGISMFGCGGNSVVGNFVGTDVSGMLPLGNGSYGITLELGGFDSVVRGNLVSSNGHFGVYVGDWGSDYNLIVGNLIGTDATGRTDMGNATAGVGVGGWFQGGWFNRIGGTRPGEANIISGNTVGIWLAGVPTAENLVLGNIIGTDVTGTRVIGDDNWHFGIVSHAGSRALIGGTTAPERNLISGRGGPALVLGSDYNCFSGNYVGTNLDGSGPAENGGASGVLVGAEHNVIQGNLLAYSTSSGVQIETYDYNTVRRNSIHASAGKGIELTNGGNQDLPAPVILIITETAISGTACPGCSVEVFSDDDEEGRTYEGTTVADAVGHFTFDKGSPLAGPFVTATATDSEGNTSEFSAPVARVARAYLPLVLRRR
ncbi:MAG TPA: right-handed parallel beta-helix repeat-containing protein [Anaerolineae bacterium]|nr:right-handed parallel beta-helix repeat-containing protein [Anaerolineae bacterium]